MTLFVEKYLNNYCITAMETNEELDSYGDTYLVVEDIPSTITILELTKMVREQFPTCHKLVFAF